MNKFLLEFGHFQQADQLPFAEAVAHFDGQCLDIAGDFGMDVDLLPRAKFGCEFQVASEIDAQNRGHCDSRKGGLRCLASGGAAGCAKEEEKGDEEAH